MASSPQHPLQNDSEYRLQPDGAPAIRAVGLALPQNYVDQETVTGALRDFWTRRFGNTRRLGDLHRAVQVGGRYLALPISEYAALDTFAKCNAAWQRVAADCGTQAASAALAAAGLDPTDIDHLFFVTVTGIATPSIDCEVINRLEMRNDIKRTPVFGLGCVAGAAGLARASDYLRAFPNHHALLLSVELCSLTLQRNDLSLANFIASGLFGDGSAAVVLGPSHADGPLCPRIVATRSVIYPNTEDLMGWDIVEGGFKVVLSPRVPEVVLKHVGGDVDAFLATRGLTRADISHWIAHTGGPKVLQAVEGALQLPADALHRSWRSLKEIGNLSSASVLFVLADELNAGTARPGEWGLLIGMGPGFCSELVLLQW